MNMLQKALLALAVAGFGIGIPVTAARAPVDPLWTLALPLGAVFLGLFLLERLWHDAIEQFNAEEHQRIEAAKHEKAAG